MRPYYAQDGVTIYHGDCRKVTAWLQADAMVTDPPYGIAWSRGINNARNSKPHDGIQGDEDTSLRDEVRAMAQGKPWIVFGSFYAPFPDATRQVLVWHKPADAGVVGSTTGYRRDAEPVFLLGPWPMRNVAWSSVIRSGLNSIAAITTATGHPHTKPVDLLMQLIDMCPPGIIADPFMGSGSTLVAAKRLGRKAIGVELEERYCEIAAQRLSQGALDLFGEATA